MPRAPARAARRRAQRGAGRIAVSGQVVAAEHREWAAADAATPLQAACQPVEGRVGRASRVSSVSALGHGERQDRRLGRGDDLGGHGDVVARRVREAGDRADDGRLRLAGSALDEGVEVVLRGQRLRHRGVAVEEPETGDAPVRAGRGELVDVAREVRAMEPADADVRDARPQPLPVVARHRDAQRADLGQPGLGEAEDVRAAHVPHFTGKPTRCQRCLGPLSGGKGLTSHTNPRMNSSEGAEASSPHRRRWRRRTMSSTRRLAWAAALIAVTGAVAGGCGDDSDDAGGTPASGTKGGEINVAIVDNPQMKDIAELTPKLFTEETGIKVNYTILDEGTLREVTTRDVAAGGRQFDVAMIGMFEAPQFGSSGSLVDLTPQAAGRRRLRARRHHRARAQRPVGRRQALCGAVLRRVVVPDVPQGRAEEGRRQHLDQPDVGRGRRRRAQGQLARHGRHLPARQAGLGRPRRRAHDGAEHVRRHLVVRRGRRRDRRGADRPARVPRGAEFYVGLIKDAGEKDAANASFNECLVPVQRRQGRHVVRRDRRRRPARGRRQPGQGQERLRAGAGQEDRCLGLAVVVGARDPEDHAASRTSPGSTSRGRPAPSTSRRPARRSPAAGRRSRRARATRPTRSPSTRRRPPRSPSRRCRRWSRRRSTTRARPRPGLPGVQYVGVPEFQDVGNQCTQQFSAVIAGRTAIDAALENCQQIASAAAGSDPATSRAID